MIYCVIPETLEAQLFDRLSGYYADDDGVTVIVDRRRTERRSSDHAPSRECRRTRDRRRPRIAGDFPPLESQ